MEDLDNLIDPPHHAVLRSSAHALTEGDADTFAARQADVCGRRT